MNLRERSENCYAAIIVGKLWYRCRFLPKKLIGLLIRV